MIHARSTAGDAMTEYQKATMRDMLECHREMMLERAEDAQCERVTKACRAVAEKDARMIARLSDGAISIERPRHAP